MLSVLEVSSREPASPPINPPEPPPPPHQQGSPPSTRHQRPRERGTRHPLLINLLHRFHLGDRQIAAPRPHVLADLAGKALRPHSWTANEKRNRIRRSQRPIDRRGRFLVHSVLADIARHANHFTPTI